MVGTLYAIDMQCISSLKLSLKVVALIVSGGICHFCAGFSFTHTGDSEETKRACDQAPEEQKHMYTTI